MGRCAVPCKLNRFIVLAFVVAVAVLTGYDLGATTFGSNSVRRVNDGDTVQLDDGRPVRYIGVNTPEITHERNTAEPFGFEARAYNIELVGSQRIRLEFDIERFDDYGRTLAYVFLADGSMVNERLVQAGLAYCLYKMPNVKYDACLLKAQREAMRARHGIWKDWRETEGKYVGNRNSRRFHAVACPEVKRISPKNRILFLKRWDAFWAGYSPSRECQADFIVPSK
jgi:micrococcal nuclease